MTQFIPALLGGLLIGASAVGLLYWLGRIAGVSGILWGALSSARDTLWRWLFVAGLLMGAWLGHRLTGVAYPSPSELPLWQAILGGLVVGVGVKLGSGCTSGHGVCGIGRLSPRSIVATAVFMATGIVAVYLIRHVW
ncbi:YeeE/YedE family protein [Gilvimarinus agarilyticus]|uniref:YeeE/YedE family protein n=1 Tax=unclassified Gilvimarinus TaxID=2642066 RepID=UPI001C0855B7|nr:MULTISPECIES: YeeE/YedE thiosulfate transporter family protein [unclassified Gilvimarinus]MBU2885583.1 YeeE/YedE family protein [Gilvimarinus agarilyticus]MDO6570450.1 YeeE/YedE thiosulfate transporter family protein [Gilvimarinus sp. 2_MG-2023]MDO6746502.1 YeeE/YedE thiosulfate transporter family protein [Gilvimarinus sp. 1_MG-2023]